ncbi:MAG: septum formation inhibitor Maf [Ruminococcaceae bacterium]|nr:septum formation inhibitor Maf [Oscillospiraceae bacterium]
MKEIILASNSPRRKELLGMLGLEFSVIPDNTPECIDQQLSPAEVVMALAKFKGDNVRKTLSKNRDAIIIAADTVVAIDGVVLGKPKSKADAEKMLSRLSGKSHNVYTGVYLIENLSGKSANFYEKTEVFFKNLDINEIKDYINTGEPMDKAGSYGIQNFGSLFVEKINGDYFNVVGLPVCSLGKTLTKDFGIKFF